MTKLYLLDTNVLLTDPEALFNFKENEVIIPIGVLEELDSFKKDHGELGRNSRQVCRNLDALREKGDLSVGVGLDNGVGGKVRIFYTGNANTYYREAHVDFQVLQAAQTLKDKEPQTPCVIVSRDVNVRIRANALGLAAENYENKQVTEEIDKGYSEIIVSHDLINELNENSKLSLDRFSNFISKDVPPNYYFIMKSDTKSSSHGEIDNLLAKVSPDKKNMEVLNKLIGGLRLKPKNVEQTFVLDSLLDERVKLVSIIGSAGSGKTLMAVCVGYYLLSKTDNYNKLLISRPMIPMGNKDTMGFLPGGIEEKLDPWMQPIYDAFEVLMSNKKDIVDGREFVHQQKNIAIEVLSYIRGRSINDQFLILDESQNTTHLEVKTIITRAGENTKVILTGDIDQIDNPYMDKTSNGLTLATKAFVGSSLASHFVLSKCVRSKLSDEASHRL